MVAFVVVRLVIAVLPVVVIGGVVFDILVDPDDVHAVTVIYAAALTDSLFFFSPVFVVLSLINNLPHQVSLLWHDPLMQGWEHKTAYKFYLHYRPSVGKIRYLYEDINLFSETSE